MYHTKSTEPNIFLQDWNKYTKPNLLNQMYKAKTAKLNLKNQIYQPKCLQCKEPNILNQIHSIKPTKVNPSNQFYQPKSREIESTKYQTEVQFQLELSLAQLSPSLFYIFFFIWWSHFQLVDLIFSSLSISTPLLYHLN